MNVHRPVHRVAIVGTGTIGASWATHYLVRGFDVTATDPAPTAEAALRAYMETAWDAAASIGLAPEASPDRLSFTTDLRQAVADADFVQENAPERPELKVPLFADIDDATPPGAIIASSSSGITMSVIQAVAGVRSGPSSAIPSTPAHRPAGRGRRRYEDRPGDDPGRHVVLRRDRQEADPPQEGASRARRQPYPGRAVPRGRPPGPGGVLDVADSDDAVSWGPGLRWGVMGPHLLWHLGGGEGGIQHFMDTLMPRMVASWQELGTPEFTPELMEKIVGGVLEEAAWPLGR